jgi:D-ribulokinase
MAGVTIGVDVGTASVRVGVFSLAGTLLASARHPIEIWRAADDIYEQSSDDIWAAFAASLRVAMAEADVTAADVRGLGFDATCSLVALDDGGRPVTVSPSGEARRNIILWMDHRATREAREIDATGHAVLGYLGGSISPEMQTPKLLWLKRHLPADYGRAANFFDLADFLTFRATGSLARSLCTLTCKWTYLAHEGRFAEDYFHRIGLGDLAEDGFRRIGREIVAPGTPLGRGLSEAAAAELGLAPGTPVGASLIDAHAGALATLGGRNADGVAADPARRVAFIMGTSACVMAVSAEPRFIKGVWGPYFAALLPGWWLTEGGQSAAGAAIDHLLRLHPACARVSAEAAARSLPLTAHLEQMIVAKNSDLSQAALRARDLHVQADFIGNRSPFADPGARGAVAGLTLADDAENLADLYVAGLCGLGYGSAQILSALAGGGYALDTVVMSGGASHSPLVRQIMADTTGLAVALPQTEEPVLLGAAMLGAVAGGAVPDLASAMAAMSATRAETRPAGGRMREFHGAKRAIFEDLQRLDRAARARMAGVG